MWQEGRRDGENQCAKRCSQEYVQCREAGQATGATEAVFQGHHQVLDRHAETRYETLRPMNSPSLMQLYVARQRMKLFSILDKELGRLH